MGRHIEHRLLAPDGRPLLILANEPVRSGETLQAFIRRNNWRFDLPTRCFVNGEVIRPSQLTKIRIRVRDEIVIVSRPGIGGGRSGSPSTAKTVGSIVAMVALAVLAPWAGGALAGALGLAGATLGGVAYSSIFGGVILGAGGMLLSQFFKPKSTQTNKSSNPIYSISAAGNQAKPLGMIPVGYGQRLRYPDYGAPPYSTYVGNDQFLYQLFCIGCGDYDPQRFLLDDTPFWTSDAGLNPAFDNVQFQWVRPGEQVTLFPLNVTSASEVSGQRLPSPSKDPAHGGWVGPFSISPPDTETREIWLDYVWPSGAGATRNGREYAMNVPIRAEGRPIDDAGAPIGGEGAAWVTLLDKVYTINSQVAYRVTEKIPTPGGGRWQVRSKRLNDSQTDTPNESSSIQAHDDVSWTAARALIDGPQSFTGVTMFAVAMKADAQLSAGTQNRIGVIACRKLEIFNGTSWVTTLSRNPVDASIDIWRNADYSAGLSANHLVLQDLLLQRDAATARGDTFDHYFEDAVSIQEALETSMRVILANPAFIGDRMSIVRDEPKAPRMFFTDAEIVRGSLTIKRQLLDDTWADGVVVNYFDERTNRSATAASAEGLLRPSRIEVPGISKAEKAVEAASYLAAVNRYRRRRVSFQVELEGRMLKRNDLVILQSELPQSWGQGGEVRTFLIVNGIYQLTLDAPVTFADGQPHFVLLRQRNGRPFGPVRVTAMSGSSKIISLDPADLALVEGQAGSIMTKVLDRQQTEDPPTYSFSQGAPREYRGLVVSASMRDAIATLETVIEAPEVHAVVPGNVPPIPNVPSIFNDAGLPVITRISARAYQRAATLYLAVEWDPVPNAALYLAQVAYVPGSWAEAYRDSRASFEVGIGSIDRVYVQVACITAGGMICRFVQTFADVPPLEIDGSLFKDLTVRIEKLSQQTQLEIASINARGRDALAGAAGTATTTIRDVIQELTDALHRLGDAQATQSTNSFQSRQLTKVGDQANYAAIEREEIARIGADDALASITTTLGVQLTLAKGDIVANATAIQGLSTHVSNIDGTLTSQAAAITNLASRIDANDLAISGQATATQQLVTRVTLTEGNILSVSQAVTALQSTVSSQGGQIAGQATALSNLTTQTSQNSAGVSSLASDVTALYSSAYAQDAQINNLIADTGANASAVSSLTTRANSTDGVLTAQATYLQALQTTVGGHTATLTTYGTSINGIQAQFGVTFEIDGATGGYVMTGARSLDGSVSFVFKLRGDFFADGSITGRAMVAYTITTTQLTTGQLIVNGHVFDNALSTVRGTEGGGWITSYTFTNSRGQATRLAIFGLFYPRSSGGFGSPAQAGQFEIRANGNVIRQEAGVTFPASGQWYMMPMFLIKQIDVGSGTFDFQVAHTNAASAGVCDILVMEISK